MVKKHYLYWYSTPWDFPDNIGRRPLSCSVLMVRRDCWVQDCGTAVDMTLVTLTER